MSLCIKPLNCTIFSHFNSSSPSAAYRRLWAWSALVQVMIINNTLKPRQNGCHFPDKIFNVHPATSLSQCWPGFISPFCVTRSQWVKYTGVLQQCSQVKLYSDASCSVLLFPKSVFYWCPEDVFCRFFVHSVLDLHFFNHKKLNPNGVCFCKKLFLLVLSIMPRIGFIVKNLFAKWFLWIMFCIVQSKSLFYGVKKFCSLWCAK